MGNSTLKGAHFTALLTTRIASCEHSLNHVWKAVLNLELELRTKTTSTLSAVVYLLALVFLVSVLALFYRRKPSLDNPTPPFKGHINIRLGILALYCLLFAA